MNWITLMHSRVGLPWKRDVSGNRKVLLIAGPVWGRQLLSDLFVLERDLMELGMDRSGAQGLICRSIFTQYLIDREIVTEQFLKAQLRPSYPCLHTA